MKRRRERTKLSRGICVLTVLVLLGAAVASCTTTAGQTGDTTDGSVFSPTEVGMVATQAWGNAVQIAEFTPGVVQGGVESVEVSLPYGETAVLYHFDGLEPNAPVAFKMNANVDTFMTDSFIEIGIIPGKVGMERAVHPRDLMAEYLAFKWIDSVGRFAGEPYPDATDGWETLETTEFSADETGEITVMIIVNHWTETPPVVYHYFTNPEVRSSTEG